MLYQVQALLNLSIPIIIIEIGSDDLLVQAFAHMQCTDEERIAVKCANKAIAAVVNNGGGVSAAMEAAQTAAYPELRIETVSIKVNDWNDLPRCLSIARDLHKLGFTVIF